MTGTTPAAAPVTTSPASLVESVPAGAIDDLRSRLHGTVLTPEDPDYVTTGLPANARYQEIRPAVIAQCRDETDVITCVQWASDNGVQPVPRGGGHSYAGLSTTSGLLIDLSALSSVALDQSTGVAVVGGAALNQDLLNATINTPFYLPGGTCLGVGVGGLVLGGGIGYNTHWAGLTCDHLVSSRIVVASGELVEIDATHHPDLYWACRGGTGGTFGLNTSFTFQLVEVPATVTYFRYDFTGADAAGAMLAEFSRVCAIAPSGFNSSASATATPVGAGGPREAILAFFRGQYVGPPDELRDLVAPILAAATPTQSAFQEMPFWDVQSQIWATPNPPPHDFGDVSRYARDPVPDEAMAEVIDVLADCPVRTDSSNGSMWSLGWVGGDVMNSIGRTDTAYVHRGMSTLLRPTPVWEPTDPPSVGEDLIAWTDDMIAVIAPYTPNESYQNFPNRLLPDPLEQYFAENLERLIDVKTAYDPNDLFHNVHTVRPR
jgi:FAD/FMN-containing dehydrogenase